MIQISYHIIYMGEEMVYIKTKVLTIVLICLVVIILGVVIIKSENIACFTPVTNKRIIIDAGHGFPDRRN